ncbi:MAG: hypothetical protein EBX41_04225 [Chitinophagia bacterium]|nr:hypothetical protein [Chitinophagia bacterium]
MKHIISSFSTLIFCLLTLNSCKNTGTKWKTYKSVEGGFSINMPEELIKKNQVEKTPFGKQIVHYIIWKPDALSIGKFKLFQVSYTDCPDNFLRDSTSLKRTLDSSISLRKQDFTFEEYHDEIINFNGYPGVAIIHNDEKNNVTVLVKQCFTNHKRYDLTAIARRDLATNEEINNFFNSFTIIKN